MALMIYNTLSRKKEIFKPVKKDNVTFYSCGQTVYDDLHIGNARMYSNWDIVTRYLEWKGYHVLHVQNFTDVGHLTSDADSGEDKIEKRAAEKKLNPWELVDRQIQKYYKDTDELNIKRPNIMPRATSVIPEMIELVQKLIDKKFAYVVKKNVYFDTSKFKNYGELAQLKLEEDKTKPRVIEDANKKNYFDFALWLSAEKEGGKFHVMNWNSPWGKGYPGWHLECSVMAMKFLGETIDLHAGGIDHIPVHHTNEIAQSEAATGKKFVNYWMHGEFITVNGEKMSKSKGNFYTSRELMDKWGSMVVRYALVNTHYRKRVDFTDELFLNAKNNIEKIYDLFDKLDNKSVFGKLELDKETEELKKNFSDSMDDDFNTSQALASIHEFIKKANINMAALSKNAGINAREKITELIGVLGIRLEKKKETDIEPLMNLIISIRNKLRDKKDYETSDYLRGLLKNIGIELKDDKDKTIWTKK
ncbi:Cysteine--tRNA ligase [Candidatus Tiddalikarchaeum anstoanum]|nr:Cysteine--tRNA ligase [Candidatus Tiddalikarchaeum anstoanum]